MENSDVQELRYRKLLELLARKDYEQILPEDRIPLLKQRSKKLNVFFIANVLFASFFLFSHYQGISQLGKGWMYGIIIITVVNLYFIYFQKSQLKKALDFFSKSE